MERIKNTSPSILHSKSYTLHSLLLILHTTFFTVNPTPYILHSQSYTLHSSLCILQLLALQQRSEFDIEETLLVFFLILKSQHLPSPSSRVRPDVSKPCRSPAQQGGLYFKDQTAMLETVKARGCRISPHSYLWVFIFPHKFQLSMCTIYL